MNIEISYYLCNIRIAILIFNLQMMTQAEFNSYRFNSQNDPSDEQLGQLMENAAKKVRETNRESDVKFYQELRRASDEAKSRTSKSKNP